jgi:hypothetical protein
MGLDSGVFDRRLFSAVALMVMVTTFVAIRFSISGLGSRSAVQPSSCG